MSGKSSPAIRQRVQSSQPTQKSTTSKKPSAFDLAIAEDAPTRASIWLDILRSLVFLVLLSCGLSYFITGASFFWNARRPAFTYPSYIKSLFSHELLLTDAEISRYNGSDPALPIYLAIKGTIYDVSLGRNFYGPGGSYHFFSGADASRAFVTTCFDTDITPDMRGVEEMFLPIDDEEIDGLYSKGEMKILREAEKRKAKAEVERALGHWVGFFEGSKKYTKVGRMRREKVWEEKGETRELCDKARKGRMKRSPPAGKVKQAGA